MIQKELAAGLKIILEPGNKVGNFFPKTRKQYPENNKRLAEGPGAGQANGWPDEQKEQGRRRKMLRLPADHQLAKKYLQGAQIQTKTKSSSRTALTTRALCSSAPSG